MTETRASLLVRIRDDRDRLAWSEFDAIYRPMLKRYARSFGVSDDDAEDVAQQCMSAIHKHIGRFEYDQRRGRFKSWLKTMVSNQVKNLRRRVRPIAGDTQDFQKPQVREETPEQSFERIWTEEHVRHCLKKVRKEVDAQTFEAYRLYVIKDLPTEKVCEALGMTPNQVHKIKHRITRKLREKWSELMAD